IVLLVGVAFAGDRILSIADKAEIAAYLRSSAAKARGTPSTAEGVVENRGVRSLAAEILDRMADRLVGEPTDEPAKRLKVMFVITCMPVGGAETLLVELVRRLDRRRFDPEVCCLKYRGPLGEVLAREIPVHTGLLANKYDVRVLPRLWWLMIRRRVDAVVTVGTGGDKMFWGRLAAFFARVPVICSALHSTGLPDRVEWLNRRLAFLTDAFIAVAKPHGIYLAEHEGCPAQKVRVIPNGVDTDRFSPGTPRDELFAEFGIDPGTPIVTIVAALRPEKNHELFLKVASRVLEHLPRAHFLVVGDGERRKELVDFARRLGLRECVHFLGTRTDIADIWRISTVGVLTSHMEANPVSLLEAMACGKPVVAPRVGSIPETVHDGENGFLVPPGDVDAFAARIRQLLSDSQLAAKMGKNGRGYVQQNWSIDRMIAGYQAMIEEIYRRKRPHALPDEPTDASVPASQRAAPILTALLDSPWNVAEEAADSPADCCGVG
ncbi:MAG: glycosyltransferase, partial [Planctomycetota bacterium]